MNQDNAQTISYIADFKRRMFPVGSVILLIINFIWIGFTNDKITAIAFIIGFGMLALVEFLMNWYRANSHYGVQYTLDNEGFTAKTGSYSKRYQWSTFTGFVSEYQAKFGDYLAYIPFASFLYTPEEKYKLVLYQNNPTGMFSTGDQQPIFLMTTPAMYEGVVAFIKQYLPFKPYQRGFGPVLWPVVIIFTVLAVVSIILAVVFSR